MPESDTVESLQRILAGFNTVFKETQEANLRQILAAQTENTSNGSGSYSTKPPHFRGEEVDDVRNDFIKSFNRFADFYKWPSDKRMRVCPSGTRQYLVQFS